MSKLKEIAKRVFKASYNSETIEQIREYLYEYVEDLDNGNMTTTDMLVDMAFHLRQWFPEHFTGAMSLNQTLTVLGRNSNRNPGMLYVKEFLEKILEDKLDEDPLKLFKSEHIRSLCILVTDESLNNLISEEDQRTEIAEILGRGGCKRISKLFQPHLNDLHTLTSEERIGWARLLILGVMDRPELNNGVLNLEHLIRNFSFFNDIIREGDLTNYDLANYLKNDFKSHAVPLGFTWTWADRAPEKIDRIEASDAASNYFVKIEHPSGIEIYICPAYGLNYTLHDYFKLPDKPIQAELSRRLEVLQTDQYIQYWDDLEAHIKEGNNEELQEFLSVDRKEFQELKAKFGPLTARELRKSNSSWHNLFEEAIYGHIQYDDYLLEFVKDLLLEESTEFYATEVYRDAIIGGDPDAVEYYNWQGYTFDELLNDWETPDVYIKLPNSGSVQDLS